MAIEILLSQRGKHAGEYSAWIDDRHDKLALLNWNVIISKTTQYAVRTTMSNGVRKDIYLHRAVMALILERPLTDLEEVDHINLNGLDCTDGNLRIATRQQNIFNRGIRKDNRTGFKGVGWKEDKQKFYARIRFNGKCYFLGHFDDPAEAHKVYCEKADELHQDFANHGVKPNE